FLDRILPLELIQQVAIHAPRETIEILYPPKCPQNDFLAEFATTLGREAPSGSGFAAGLCLERLRPGPVRIFRNSWGVATWRIAHELPGRIRVRHEELVNHQDAARFIRQKLETAVGVNRAEVSSRTGGALIEFDSDRLTPAQLLYLLESWMRDFSSPAPGGYEHTGSSAVVSHATLGLATAADFILPALAPASAGLLVLTNLKTLRDAAAEIRRMRPGVATLYTTIAGCTLASGFFFSAAMMAWLMHYWDRRYHRRLTDGQRELVLDRRRKPYFVWRCRGSTEVETPVDQLQTGDVIAVRAGEIIPVDGTVESGSARVDEHPVHGVTEWQLRTEGDEVFAASRIQEGGLRIRVSRIGEETRAAVIGDL
ncbi:MAG: hypothetical protein NT069_29425, partial [Planctomycetota bacterium]|nr:hypothetical protein [Planctomycetota bacterium]